MIGELRGWTSDGQSVLGIQSYESDSVDAWATSLATNAPRAALNPTRSRIASNTAFPETAATRPHISE